jgi:hypothetical protein
MSPKMKEIALKYSKTIISSNIDDRYEAIGSSIQIGAELSEIELNNDRSNMEMVMSKAVKISIDNYGMKQKLEDVETRFIIPNYGN